jgi:hypothetical protein
MHWDAAPTSAAILRRNDHPLARLADNAIAREYGRHSPRIYKMPPNSRAEVKIREELDVLRQKAAYADFTLWDEASQTQRANSSSRVYRPPNRRLKKPPPLGRWGKVSA